MADIKFIVTDIFSRIIDIDASKIDLDLNIFSDYGLTSLNLVIMLTNICDKTNIPVFNFTDNDISNLRTLADVVNMFSIAARHDA